MHTHPQIHFSMHTHMHVQIHIHIHIHMHKQILIYIYTYAVKTGAHRKNEKKHPGAPPWRSKHRGAS